MTIKRDKSVAIWRKMPTLYGDCMVPANDLATAMLASVKGNTEVIGEFKTVRSVEQLRLFWALMQLLVEQDIFPTKESASDATKIACGHCSVTILPDTGEVHFGPASIALGSMPQHDFNLFFDNMLDVVCHRWLGGADKEAVRERIYEMIEPPERRALGKRVDAA